MAIRRVRLMITINNLDYIVHDVAFKPLCSIVMKIYKNGARPIVVVCDFLTL
jgi:hypothetical protein